MGNSLDGCCSCNDGTLANFPPTKLEPLRSQADQMMHVRPLPDYVKGCHRSHLLDLGDACQGWNQEAHKGLRPRGSPPPPLSQFKALKEVRQKAMTQSHGLGGISRVALNSPLATLSPRKRGACPFVDIPGREILYIYIYIYIYIYTTNHNI